MRSSDTAVTLTSYPHGDNEFNRGINSDPRSRLSSNASESEMPTPKEPEEPSSKFLWLSKREGVSGLNVSTFFLLQLATALVTTFMNTFLIYIVKDPEYYNVKKEDAGSTLGNLTFTVEIFIIPSHLVFGLLMDAAGRRYPTSIGLVLAGVCIALIPEQHATVFPILYILR